MDDRGEKIITLAREMLRSSPDFSAEPARETASFSMSFKVLCLATALTAAGSSAITYFALDSQRPISRYERVELEALVFYMSRLKGMEESAIRKDVEEKLKISSFDDIREQDFQAIRRYLQNKAL